MCMATQKRPQWYHPDVQLMTRMVLTMFLLGLVYIVFVLVLWQVLHFSLTILIFFAAVIAGVQFFMADKIVLWSMNAQEVTEAQAPKLHAMIERLAQQANLPKPRIAIAQTSVPNAFATGRNEKHAVVCVTSGIMDRLNDQEMEAVLAHEMTHILNHDMLVMAIASFFAMVAALLTTPSCMARCLAASAVAMVAVAGVTTAAMRRSLRCSSRSLCTRSASS